LDIRDKLFTLRAARHWPEWWWVFQPWRHTRSGWRGSKFLMELWVSLVVAGEWAQLGF